MSICIRSGRTNASRKALKMELAEPYFGQRHWITVESHFYTVMILIEIYVYSCEVLRCFCVKTKHRISELYDMITNHGGKKRFPFRMDISLSVTPVQSVPRVRQNILSSPNQII